jgi:hypothetical protein
MRMGTDAVVDAVFAAVSDRPMRHPLTNYLARSGRETALSNGPGKRIPQKEPGKSAGDVASFKSLGFPGKRVIEASS